MGLAHALAELVHHAGQGQVDQDGAKAHGHQQSGLKAFFNGQPDQDRTHHIHDNLLGSDGQQIDPQEIQTQRFFLPFLLSVWTFRTPDPAGALLWGTPS